MRIKNLLKLICCCVCPSEESQENKSNNHNELPITSNNGANLVHNSNNMSNSNGKSEGSIIKLFKGVKVSANKESTMPFGNSKDIGESSGIVPNKPDNKKANHENCDDSSINSSSPDNLKKIGTDINQETLFKSKDIVQQAEFGHTTDDKIDQSIAGETPGEDGGWIIV